MPAFDPRAYNLYHVGIAQAQQKIANFQKLAASASGSAKAMYAAAARQEQQRLASLQKAAASQESLFPVQVNEAQYGQAKADINQQFGGQLASQDYARSIAQQRFAREQGDFNIAANRQRVSSDQPYLRRGVFRSGIRQAGLSRLREDQTRQYGAMSERQAGELGTLAQQRMQTQQQQQSALNAVDRQRQQAIFQRLQALQGYR